MTEASVMKKLMTELTKVIWQRNDITFIQLLNKITAGDLGDFGESILKEQYVEQDDCQKYFKIIYLQKLRQLKVQNELFPQLNSSITSVEGINQIP